MFIVFEGIDGSGKTTLSSRVARELRGAGITVEHVREGGSFASAIAAGIRAFTRDSRNLRLSPESELLLYAAREAQLLREVTIPALARAEVVIADRFFYSAEVLACEGRGLPHSQVHPVLESSSGGVKPDLVILIDADPHIARARRRVSRIVSPRSGPSSRKGLTGVGLQHRIRAGYRKLAAADPSRWVIVENDDAEIEDQVGWICALIRIATGLGAAAAVRASGHRPLRSAPPRPVHSLDDARDAFLARVDERARREPAVAAYLLAGLAGPGIDERRFALAQHVPEVIAWGLRGLDDAASWHLRETLAMAAPRQIARSLSGIAGLSPQARPLREKLAGIVAEDVAASLDARDDEEAWELRARLAGAAPARVLASLKRIASDRAWELRDALAARVEIAERAEAMCDAVTGLAGDRAWSVRDACFSDAPVAALASLDGLAEDRAWAWRQEFLARATRVVLRSTDGMVDPRAFDLRESVAARCKEAIDSITGLDGERAWALRESCADLWPSTVVKSLGPVLACTSRGRALLERQLAKHPGDLSLLKHASAIPADAQQHEAHAG